MYKLFSVDDHVLEPPDTWQSRVSARHRDRAPKLVERDGKEFWQYEDVIEPTLGVLAVVGRPPEEWGIEGLRYADMHPSCYNPQERAKDFYSNGIFASLAFPTLPGFGGRKFAQLKDKELALECVRAWNDFILDEWCPGAPDLLVPMTITALWDIELAVAEVERCLTKGTRALSFVDDPAKMGLPGFYTDEWDPLMRLCDETSLPLCMHLGSGGSGSLNQSGVHPMVEIAASVFTMGALATINLLCSPIPRKFPDVKYVWSESGIGWVPAALERADRMYERHRLWMDLDAALPSELCQRSMWFSMIEEPIGLKYRYDWDPGVTRLLWETDFPHSETPWPHTQAAVKDVLQGVPSDEVERITHENAEHLFNWKLRVPDDVVVTG